MVAEVGASTADDQIYRLTYDGSIADEHGYAVMGGPAEQVADYVGEHFKEGISLAEALRLAVDALGHDGGEVRQLIPRTQIEVASWTGPGPRCASSSGSPAASSARSWATAGEPTRTPAPALAVGSPLGPRTTRPTRPTPSAVPPLEDPVTGEPPIAPPV